MAAKLYRQRNELNARAYRMLEAAIRNGSSRENIPPGQADRKHLHTFRMAVYRHAKSLGVRAKTHTLIDAIGNPRATEVRIVGQAQETDKSE